MTDVYKEKGYDAGRIGFGEQPGVLVVDFQTGFTDGRFPLGGRPLVVRAVENAARLLEVARRYEIPVASCYIAYKDERDTPYWKVEAVLKEFRHGHPCTELDPQIHDPEYDLVFPKTGPSMFFQTPLVSYLTKNRVDTVIITGCNTSGCIRATCIDSFQYGFRTIIPEDCVGDLDEGPHRDNLRDVGRRYADIVTGDEVIAFFEDWHLRNLR
ncbi:MAG: isochorismatase family protein [Planctomycetota bacterium]|nr:isochorismatase family protein [Planctomycetota bacterium]